jgi:hypothetical protein
MSHQDLEAGMWQRAPSGGGVISVAFDADGVATITRPNPITARAGQGLLLSNNKIMFFTDEKHVLFDPISSTVQYIDWPTINTPVAVARTAGDVIYVIENATTAYTMDNDGVLTQLPAITNNLNPVDSTQDITSQLPTRYSPCVEMADGNIYFSFAARILSPLFCFDPVANTMTQQPFWTREQDYSFAPLSINLARTRVVGGAAVIQAHIELPNTLTTNNNVRAGFSFKTPWFNGLAPAFTALSNRNNGISASVLNWNTTTGIRVIIDSRADCTKLNGVDTAGVLIWRAWNSMVMGADANLYAVFTNYLDNNSIDLYKTVRNATYDAIDDVVTLPTTWAPTLGDHTSLGMGVLHPNGFVYWLETVSNLVTQRIFAVDTRPFDPVNPVDPHSILCNH